MKSTLLYIAAAMVAFAANSLLCRMALSETNIDPASFTFIRLLSGAITLSLLLLLNKTSSLRGGSWWGALALFIYAAGFSFAYVNISTGTGALLLFGAVQVSMIAWGFFKGEAFSWIQSCGFVLAVLGLVILLSPGLTSPPFVASGLMVIAGVAWGVYSLMGRGASSALLMTGGNFVKATPLAAVLLFTMAPVMNVDTMGFLLAVLSGALASGLGYALWYQVLPQIKATNAATIQLSVPVIATLMGWIFLGEAINLRIILASVAILGGIVLVIQSKKNT
ncbi:DMT family transporter [Aestuariibacter sp. A3R04]|uniref:DMT family transporter n=1 Tax=Aestuariibacter sp. A3R04 TaxID=2841571 RepID=UPI001C090C21|nr:DMT family transporter [Aestuariibacter sp. A3R04]MBU3022804.1 DMT family transporter [Aestuariibacter sp. A3R04]